MRPERSFLSCAVTVVIGLMGNACSSVGDVQTYDAYGYLSPGPQDDGELIGTYESRAACEKAADAWASNQVVGNPVHTECYPVDRN